MFRCPHTPPCPPGQSPWYCIERGQFEELRDKGEVADEWLRNFAQKRGYPVTPRKVKNVFTGEPTEKAGNLWEPEF